MELELAVENLTFHYHDVPVLRDVSIPTMRAGEVTAVVGPNAAGKSTLLKCIAGIQHPAGRVSLSGHADRDTGGAIPALRWRRPRRTDRILYSPQEPPPASSITVYEAVLLARQGQMKGRPGQPLLDEIGGVLARLHLDELATRPISDLSGGQRQLVTLAQAVIRKPAVLLLDEPTSSLDLRNALQLLAVVEQIARTQPAIVVITMHDLGLASRFADRIVVMSDGQVHSTGEPATTITQTMLREVYRIDADVHTTSAGVVSVSATRSL